MPLYDLVVADALHGHTADNVHQVWFEADPIDIRISNRGAATGWPTDVRDPLLDTWWYCTGWTSGGELDPGVITITLGVSGDNFNRTVVADPIDIAIGVSGTDIAGLVLSGIIDIAIGVSGEAYLVPAQTEWVWTSRIGHLSFDKDDGGEVTKRPMPWSGWIYAIKKLGNGVIVYGQNGVSSLIPVGLTWKLETLHQIGLKGKNSVVAVPPITPTKHVFIDKAGNLVTIGHNGGVRIAPDSPIQVVDYSLWLSALSNLTVLSYDQDKGLIYISDGTRGFVLSETGLGQGPSTITGGGYKTGTFYATASVAPTFDPMALCTDTLDFGTRTKKTITGLSLGVNATNDLYGAIDYRWSKAQAFITSPWVKADREGEVHLTVSGTEFRIRVKQLTYEAIEFDYITVHGKVADLLPLGEG